MYPYISIFNPLEAREGVEQSSTNFEDVAYFVSTTI